MAIAAGAVWEVRTTADASNAGGGFFVTGASGSDFSQQNSPQYALTGVTSAGAGNTILSASAAADMVGNGIHTVSGTNFTNNSWFEITSVVAGVSITCSTNAAGASISTGVGATGVMNVGGALSLATSGASGDDDVFEACAVGNTWYVKGGTYTLGEAVSIALAGTAASPIKVYGYQTTRGDNPTGTNRPLFATGANGFTGGASWWWYNMRFTGTSSNAFAVGNEGIAVNCKSNNASTTSARNAVNCGTDGFIFNCEGQSNRGRGLASGGRGSSYSNFFHDSNVGWVQTSTGQSSIVNNIISSCKSANIAFTGAVITVTTISGNTLYGYETPTGTGCSFVTGNQNLRVLNNIIYGFATGVDHADTQTEGFDDYNNYYNNTADVSAAGEWQKGSHDIALAPAFTSVSEVAGTAGAFVAGDGKLVDTTKNFTSLGVVAGQDFVYIVSGTGVTPNTNDFHYGISSISTTTNPNDTLNLDINPGTDTTADKVYRITIGHDFSVGTNMKAVGFPGAFQGGLTTGYLDIGAVQRQEPAGGSGGGMPILRGSVVGG